MCCRTQLPEFVRIWHSGNSTALSKGITVKRSPPRLSRHADTQHLWLPLAQERE
jgi:hypothetical protein